ncbi:MAG TPA: hypothetical protein VJR22_06525 [Candidatus Nitrosotalea sp.]|nr:hypothetical protein [Candidatus Nitrosotalea sp.]
MKILLLSIIAISILFVSICPNLAKADSGIEIQDIKTIPATIIIGHTFKMNATLVNNSTNPIFVEHGPCQASFSATFDNHILTRINNVTCTTDMVEQKINPGQKITATSPYLDLAYVAKEAGVANATVTFHYLIWNETNQSNMEENVSSPFSFTINPITKVPTLTPSRNQELIDIATSIPGIQSWSHDWQFVTMGFMTANNQPGNWQYAIVNLKASSASSKMPCDHGWDAMVTIDMKTMKVISAYYPTVDSHNCDNIATGGGPTSYGMPILVSSPLKQFKSGIAANKIQCNTNLVLIFKLEDGSPACVTTNTAQKLMERGWTREVATSNLDVNSSCNGTAILSPNYRAMMFPVLLMQPNATSCVKLTYTVIRPYGVIQDGVNWPRNETMQFHINDLNYEGDANSFGVTQGKDYTNSFSITAFPKTIDHANYPVGSNFTVTYLIRPLPNATGFYDQSIPMPMCFYYPLAVGHSAKEVDSSDFSKGMPTMLNHSCARGEDELVGVEVRGMSYTEMKLQ